MIVLKFLDGRRRLQVSLVSLLHEAQVTTGEGWAGNARFAFRLRRQRMVGSTLDAVEWFFSYDGDPRGWKCDVTLNLWGHTDWTYDRK